VDSVGDYHSYVIYSSNIWEKNGSVDFNNF
jgi:hypothetical protein